MKNPEGGSSSNTDLGNSTPTNTKIYSTEEKAKILYDAMYRNQPTFGDFRGFPEYQNEMLRRDARNLNKRLRKFSSSEVPTGASEDRWSKQSEPILTYVLGSERFLPTRNSFAHLAHEYDDKFNGTDIVFCVASKAGGYMTFSIDVATGTNPDNIKGKFEESNKQHGDNPPMTAQVKYCSHGDSCWQEPMAPHFIIGLMPSRIDDATDKVEIRDGLIVGRDLDLATDFKIASEIREQIIMQLAIIKKDDENHERISNLQELLMAITTKLAQICGVEGATPKEYSANFSKKYASMMRKMQEDIVYKNIMNEAGKRTNLARGKTALKTV